MRFVSLFSGIGGIDLGLERAGMTCVGQVENDPWCNQILEKHWPTVPRWQDIHDLDPKELPDHDLIAGGFPCQPVSLAGARLAQSDPRWLWPEFFRIVRMVRPRYVVVENVPGLASAGMGDVLGDLAQSGYDCEWQSIPAAFVGAPHLRWRIFIVGYDTTRTRWRRVYGASTRIQDVAYSNSRSRKIPFGARDRETENRKRSSAIGGEDRVFAASRSTDRMADSDGRRRLPAVTRVGTETNTGRTSARPDDSDSWTVEPDVGRVVDGVPRRVDRLRGLGNAVVPQVAELVGRMIMDTQA